MKRTADCFVISWPVRMIRWSLALVLFLFIALAFANTGPIAVVHAITLPSVSQAPLLQSETSRFESAPCPFRGYEIPSDERIECGYLIVPEDRSRPTGNTIQLAVAIIRTHNPTPAPDAILFLEGGPGYGALDDVGYFVAEVPELRAERDMILLDQRGTGYSMPDLRCVEFGELDANLRTQSLAVEEQVALHVQAAERCRDRLLGAGVKLAAYNSAENGADVNDLRLALGYEQLNLYGFSYGSRLALTVMRDFPEGVRAAVLDSALPLQAAWWEEQPVNAARAFATLFAGCASDLACHRAYPALEQHFYALVERVNAAPLLIDVTDAATGETFPQLITGDGLVAGGFEALYDKALIPYLPLAIEQIYAGNHDVVAGLAGQLAADSSVAFSAMWFSVQCQDEAPFNDQATVVANAEVYPLVRNLVLSDPTPAVCEVWEVAPSPAIETQAVQSDIPALVLAGIYDPIHPPDWSRLAASTLSRSYFYELAGASHGVGFDGCGEMLVANFIHDPTVAPDAACVAEESELRFVTDLYLNPGIYRFATTFLLNFDWIQALPLLISLTLLVSVIIVWPFVAFAAWRSHRRPTLRSPTGWMGGLAFVAALLNLSFLLGLVLAIANTSEEQPTLLLFGLPSQAVFLFLIPWISGFVTVVLLQLCVWVWYKRRGSVVGWVYYTLVALASLVFLGLLVGWELVVLEI